MPKRETKHKSKLEEMKCWPQVLQMIRGTTSITAIIEFIQIENEEYTHVKAASLRANLYSWIDRHHKDAKKRMPVKHFEMMESIDTSLDPLQAAQALFAIQFDRLMLDYSREKKRKICSSDNTQNLKLANEMVKTLSHLMLDKFKHKSFIARSDGSSKDKGIKGMNETFEQIDRVKKIYSEKYGDVAAAVALNPESRRKVYNALSKVRKGDSEPMLRLLNQNEEKLRELQITEEPKPQEE